MTKSKKTIFGLTLVCVVFIVLVMSGFHISAYRNVKYQFLGELYKAEIEFPEILNDADLRKPYRWAPRQILEPLSRNMDQQPYLDYYASLVRFLESKEVREIVGDVQLRFAQRCELDRSFCRTFFLSLFGYHDMLPNTVATLKQVETGNVGDFVVDVSELRTEAGVSFPVKVMRLDGIEESRGAVIAIHGRSSSPDHVLGLAGNSDYSRDFGRHWAEAGYTVYAPLVDNGTGLDIRMLGFSPQGYNLFQLNLLLQSLAKAGEEKIVVAGISYGALLAESLAILDAEGLIHTTISIGGSVRSSWIGGIEGGEAGRGLSTINRGSGGFSYLPDSYYLFFQGVGIYRLIYPDNLIVSVATHDLDSGPDVINEIYRLYYQGNRSERVALNYFVGMHEADPAGEIAIFETKFNTAD